MKKYLGILLLALVAAINVNAQEALTSVKAYGSKGLYEVTPTNDTIEVTPRYSASIYTMPIDTNVVIQVDISTSNPANLLWFELAADATQRTVTFDTGLEAAASTVAANKTRAWGFVFIGDRYVLVHESTEY